MFAARLAQWGTRLTAMIAVVGLMTGVPWSLVVYIGWPLPRQLPTSFEDLQRLLTTPVTDEVVIGLLAVAAWILWAAFAISLTAEAAARVRGVHTPHLPGLQPMQVLAGWLLSGITAGMLAATPLTSSGSADMAAPPPVTIQTPPPSTAVAYGPATAPAVPDGQVILLVAGQQHQYTVGKGDTLWDIAETWLGDPTRWPEIWQLNQHNTWPQVSGQVQFTDPDLIYPNWVLTLPDDATPPAPEPEPAPDGPPVEHIPPADDQPAEPDNLTPAPVGPPELPTSPGTTTPPPATPSPAATLDPDGVVPPPPGATPPGTPAVPSPTALAPAVPSPGAGTDVDEHPDDDEDEAAGQPPAGGEPGGVALPDGSWLPWVVAAGIASAMAVVWLQRQRRLRPRPGDPTPDTEGGIEPPVAEPEVVRSIRRAVHASQLDDEGPEEDGTTPETPDEPSGEPEPSPVAAPAVPGIEPLPTGGVGLVGPGAEAAARGALVAALAAGGPTDPDARTEVVIPADTLVTLLGAEAVTIGGWPRLHVADDLDDALAYVEARLLATARLLDEYEVTSLDAVYRVSPGERPVPPLLLVAAIPPPGMRMRTRTVLNLGGEERIRGLLLGGWGHGPTINVEPDGTCHPEGEHNELPDGTPARMPVLATTPAFTLLQTLREAHTGQPPSPPAAGSEGSASTADSVAAPAVNDENAPAAAPTGAEADQPADTGPAQPSPSAPAAGEASQPQGGGIAAALPKAIVHVLGPPQILNADTAARPVRAVAWELLVYLAVHRDGATPEQIAEDLWPAERRRLSAPRLHTTASNLRHALAAAAGADPAHAEHYLRKHHGRYQLHTVEVDLWQLHDATQEEKQAADARQRLAALRRACDAYHGDLGGDHDYDWVTPHRHHTRDLALQAHTTLAALVAGQHPDEAARLLSRAAQVAPLAEPVYQEAMRAYHRIGDPEAIRELLRQLSRNLDQVGAEPSDETLELAASLRTDLQRRGG